MFNLDEAIKHCEEIAMDKTNLAQTLWDSKEKARCEECAEEHNQLAQWLIELKILKTEQQSSGSEIPNNCDLISREDALMALTGEWTEITDEIIHRFIRRIKKLPSVKPQTGHWIAYEVRLPDRTILNYRCSVCGRKLIGYNTETLSEAPFCHCGARMSENPTGSKPEISSYYGLKSYVRERSE